MKVAKEFVLRCVMGEYIIVPVGQSAAQFNGIISTNATGAFLWERVQSETTKENLISDLMEEYEVTEKEADEDVSLFISELSKHGIL